MKMKKSTVKAHIKKTYGFKNSLLGSLVFILFAIVISVLTCTGIGTLLLPLFAMGYTSLWLNFAKTGKIEIGRMFTDSFSNFFKKWVLVFVTGLFTSLWSLLFVIPGIVKAYAYAMAPYILMDNPDMGVLEAITQSRKMMKGYKWKLFWIDFGFAISCVFAPLTLGLLYLDIFPRQAATHAVFYEKLKQHLAQETVEVEATPVEEAAPAQEA